MKFLLSSIRSLPAKSGVYLFKDKKDAVLYVGKAANLAKRVRSYWQRTAELSPHKQMMVKKIADIEIITASSEQEALILESVLIKKHQPPYNVVLKDDKNYQFIKIDYHYPRPIVATVRRPEQDRGRSQARYFGPYTSASELYEGLRLLRRIFPWRKKPKEPTRFERDLLQKRTLGHLPQTDEEYQQMITRLARVLEGKSDEVVDELLKRMKTLSSAKQFEQAAGLRDQITALKHIQAKQKIISLNGESQDVIGLYRQDDLAAVNVFAIRAGKLIDKLNFLLQHVQNEDDTAVLDAFLKQYYAQATNPPKELIIPVATSLTISDINKLAIHTTPSPSSERRGIKKSPPARGGAQGGWEIRVVKHLTLPSRGKKRELIKLGEENARQYLEQSLASWEKGKGDEALAELKRVLDLPDIPRRIEGYDISNISGQYAVGSMVVFTNGVPDKNEYRKFKIKTIGGANDPWMLAQVLRRRFTHNEWPQPDLVLLDGGKGQLAVVIKNLYCHAGASHPKPKAKGGEAIASSMDSIASQNAGLQNDKIDPHRFIALAKKQEEIFQGTRLKKINLHPRSPASLLLQRVRDEAHRFARAYYHLRHSKSVV